MRASRVFTVPAGRPFLPALADALLSGTLTGRAPGPKGLADATVFLPTRRAGRAFAALLAERAGSGAILLPRIVPLGDPDEAGSGGLSASAGEGGAAPPAIAPLERRLVLTRLVQAWAVRLDREGGVGAAPDVPFGVPGSPADAVGLAADLEALMDSLATEGVEWSALQEAAETEFSRYYRLTLDFVRIAHAAWPAILAERGASDPTRRLHEALLAEAGRLVRERPDAPVVAAGSTGSAPATASLLAAIAGLPSGAVVLPGLDTELDPEAWATIGGDAGGEPVFGHAQFMMHRLLRDHLRVGREDVRILGAGPDDPAGPRRRLVSELMRPAETTDRWAALPAAAREDAAREGAEGLALVEAADEREEALAIAVALREALAEPGRTAALVTPDRLLARRVAAELGRWNVAVEDSAGIALADTRAGRLARLAAEAAALDFSPAPLLALLRHPDVALGGSGPEVARAVTAFEVGVLRGPAPRPGLDGLADALRFRRGARSGRDPLPRQNLSDADWDAAERLLERLADAFGPLVAAAGPGETVDLVALAVPHAEVVDRLRRLPPDVEPEPDRSADALDRLFAELALAAGPGPGGGGAASSVRGRFRDYPSFFAALARDRTIPAEARITHRRVKILGLLEARLLDVDRVVLGGLDEGLWPPAAESDAFLNRPMRLLLGLTPPERRIGQTAHDFAQALGTRDAVLTRARKRDGKPTVPSRLLERLRAFGGEAVWAGLRRAGGRYLRLAEALDRAPPVPPLRRPAPRPGPERFPRSLSVTEVETLVRDPYAVYARHVLRLHPLPPLAELPSAAERGSILHDVLGAFTAAHPETLPPDPEAELLQRGFDAFAEIERAFPELHALWWPAFERLVPRFVRWDRERRAGGATVAAERSGRLAVTVDGVPRLLLRGRADRIELGPEGAAILDFKTGTPPSNPVVTVGFSPQLTLEAAMLRAGGFDGLPASGATPALRYVKLGGRQVLDEREVKPASRDGRSLGELVDEHLAGLARLVRRYAVEGAGYLSRPYPQYLRGVSAYDGLSRVKEWSASGAPEGGDEV